MFAYDSVGCLWFFSGGMAQPIDWTFGVGRPIGEYSARQSWGPWTRAEDYA